MILHCVQDDKRKSDQPLSCHPEQREGSLRFFCLVGKSNLRISADTRNLVNEGPARKTDYLARLGVMKPIVDLRTDVIIVGAFKIAPASVSFDVATKLE